MCSIIGSFDKNKILGLFEINKYRGNLTHSITVINPETYKVIKCCKYKTPYDHINLLNMKGRRGNDKVYYIVHVQAPTNLDSINKDNIHPAITECHYNRFNNREYLWHNGIIKEHQIKILQDLYANTDITNWDTLLLLKSIKGGYFKELNEIDGSFACIYLSCNSKHSNKPWIPMEYFYNMYLFRNITSPLFIDEDLNISSTKFSGSYSLPEEKVFQVNLLKKELKEVFQFKSKDNPYYFN